MIGVPQLGTDKHFLPLDLALLEYPPHRFAHLFFISVAFGGIELTKAHLQRGPGCLFCRARVGNQRAKAERWNLIGAVVKRHLCIAKAVGVTHKPLPPWKSQSEWIQRPFRAMAMPANRQSHPDSEDLLGAHTYFQLPASGRS